jgi:hypothetical protein
VLGLLIGGHVLLSMVGLSEWRLPAGISLSLNLVGEGCVMSGDVPTWDVGTPLVARNKNRLFPDQKHERLELRLLQHTTMIAPIEAKTREAGSGTTCPCIVKEALNVGAGLPPTMSVPTRDQSG